MTNGMEGKDVNMELFREEEVREISGLKKGSNYIEVACGYTNRRYGDTVGRLRVFLSGDLEISCECTFGCHEGNLTPEAFEKHCGKANARNWSNKIWVFMNDEKVPLSKTVLLKYYDQASSASKGSNVSRRRKARAFHRDEFIRCSRCNKERRFRLRTEEECRKHHDASLDINWKCSDHGISCDNDEERASRRAYRGCSSSPSCLGCTSCVCFGCKFCRFSDCSCQICNDFTRNAGSLTMCSL